MLLGLVVAALSSSVLLVFGLVVNPKLNQNKHDTFDHPVGTYSQQVMSSLA